MNNFGCYMQDNPALTKRVALQVQLLSVVSTRRWSLAPKEGGVPVEDMEGFGNTVCRLTSLASADIESGCQGNRGVGRGEDKSRGRWDVSQLGEMNMREARVMRAILRRRGTERSNERTEKVECTKKGCWKGGPLFMLWALPGRCEFSIAIIGT